MARFAKSPLTVHVSNSFAIATFHSPCPSGGSTAMYHSQEGENRGAQPTLDSFRTPLWGLRLNTAERSSGTIVMRR